MGKQLKLKWISEVIEDDYKTKWNIGDVVVIDSQTNTGKTTFIMNDLLGSLEDNETLLYICNRIELKRQIKIDLLKKYNFPIPEDNERLDKIHKIGNVVILSYQNIGQQIINQQYDIDSYLELNHKYIVCDEVHFFFSDSEFNNKTYIIFKELISKKYDNSIRILISGTIDNMIGILGNKIKSKIHYYTSGRDYSFLNTKYYKNIIDIVQMIRNDNTSNKWLIFVNSKNKGNLIRKELLKTNISNVFLHAKSSHKERENISRNNKFNQKVLIATKFLDNGISLKDNSINNIVLSTCDKVTFLQELGRVRIDINNAKTINLFIDTKTKRNFQYMKNILQKKKGIIDLFINDYDTFEYKYNHNIEMLPKELFYINNEAEDKKWSLNMLSCVKIKQDLSFCNKIIKDYQNKGEYTFIYEQLEWIGQERTFSKDKLIINVKNKKEVTLLNNYLESIIGTKLFNEDQQKLSNLLINELLTLSTKIDYRTKILKPSTIEKILRDDLNLPYVVSESKKETKGEMKNKRYIVISKIN